MMWQFMNHPFSGGDLDAVERMLDILLPLLESDESFWLRVWKGNQGGEIIGENGWIFHAQGDGLDQEEALTWLLGLEEGVWSLRRRILVQPKEERFQLLDALQEYARKVLESPDFSIA